MRIVIIFLGFLLVSGCASSATTEQGKSDSSFFPEEDYIVAQGKSDDSMEAAEQQAMERLARQLQVHIKHQTVSEERLVLDGAHDDYSLDMETQTEASSEMEFRGLEIERERKLAGLAGYEVTVAIDRDRLADQLEREIELLDQDIEQLTEYGTFQSRALAWDLQVQREDLNRVLYSVSGQGIPTDRSAARMRAELEDQIGEEFADYDFDRDSESGENRDVYQSYAEQHQARIQGEYQDFHQSTEGDFERTMNEIEDFARRLQRAAEILDGNGHGRPQSPY